MIFSAILAGKLPESQRDYAKEMGQTTAVLSRAILVLAIGIRSRRGFMRIVDGIQVCSLLRDFQWFF